VRNSKLTYQPVAYLIPPREGGIAARPAGEITAGFVMIPTFDALPRLNW
jgi:hypothetical protein